MRPTLLAMALAAASLPISVAHADASQASLRSSKISESLRSRWTAGEQVDVLIRLRPVSLRSQRGLTFAEQSEQAVHALQAGTAVSQKGVLDWLQSQAVAARPFWIANVIAARLDGKQAMALAARDEVVGFEWDAPFKADIGGSAPTLDELRAIEPNVTKVRAPEVWALGYHGEGVVIAGQDTGYQWDHPALKSSYLGWDGVTANHNFHWHDAITADIDGNSNPCGMSTTAPCDDNSHGTHTMGTMSGSDGGSNQIGVAPSARWIGCRNMDSGSGRPSTYLDCFQWFAAPTDLNGQNPDPARAPHVIGNSWGCPVGAPPAGEDCALDSFATAISNLKAQGILTIVAAGNSGSSCASVIDPPAIYADAFTIGATDNSDVIAGFSSRGPVTVDGSNRLKPDVVAPGVSVRSAVPGSAYGSKSGTSMATPNAVGVAALVMSANPALRGQPEQVEAILRDTAVPLTSATTCGGMPGSQIPNPIYGHGRLDALAAVQRALATSALFDDGFE